MRLAKLAALTALLLGGGLALAQPPGGTQPPARPLPGTTGPGSGPGLGAPAQPTRRVDTRPLVLTDKEMKELEDLEKDHDRFSAAAAEHDKRMRTIAKREYDTRVAELQKRYADRIAKTVAEKGKRHGDTIAILEKFLADHPAHEQFTPDAMFRLADLYLDRAEDEVEARLAALDALPQGGPIPPPDPASIVADYTPARDMWEQILTKFPSYRQTPSTLYLFAYYTKYKDERKALTAFLALACSNRFKWNDKPIKVPERAEALKRAELKTVRDPYGDCEAYPGSDTELIRHAWVRGVADHHFAIPGELDEAITSYKKVADKGTDSKLYAEALYKLAWSFYKRDFLKDAIEHFDRSVKLYDSIVATGAQPTLELRDESIQYISVAFTDPWPGETNTNPANALARTKDFYRGRENEPHVRDIWVAMGKAFADIQAWDESIASYRIAIGPPWELNPKNPMVHQEIVNIFEAKGDKMAADSTAAELATKYAPGTAWYAANEKDREAMDNQRRIAERALYAAARNTHSAATTMRKEWEASKGKLGTREEWLALYNKAVELYRVFISTYPQSDYVYEFNYNTAEALFYSERYLEAVDSYKWVRDHRDISQQFYIDAARSVVLAYEAEAARQVAAGRLVALRIPTIEEMKKLPQPFAPQPIPDIYLKMQAEYDTFQEKVNDPAEAPKQGTNAAMISLAYLHIDDAIARFTKVMDKFCGQPYAVKSKDGILAIYEAQSKFDAIEATNKKFITAKCGDDKAIKDAIVQNRSLNFSRANLLFANKEYNKAAEAFYTFYKTAPEKDTDLPVALYNAALSYKYGDRPNNAIALFKEFTDKKDKPFRESPFYLDAMRLQAASYQAKFDYNNAVATYLELYATTKRYKAQGLKAPPPLEGEAPRTLDQIGLDALFNAAVASELNRDFKKAVELYTQYQGVEPDVRRKDRAHWSVIGIYRQSGDLNSMTESQMFWRARYGKDPQNQDDFIQTYYDEAALRKKKGQTALSNQAGTEAINAWKKFGKPKNTRGAKLAGEWAVSFAEDKYARDWDPFEIKAAAATIPAFEAQVTQLKTARAKIEQVYLDLLEYGVIEYSMAATVRFGDIQFTNSLKTSNMPPPSLLNKPGNEAALEKFLNTRDANLLKFTEEAKKQWLDVLDVAKKNGISNRWSRLALENLGREFPKEFTVLRQEIIQGTDTP
ncbi:MAG: tetratricopeptide repeat protein [Deltaproteobacteria bacterium]|nr:tetratricopeptide repeat protein [Deltaproteobacteria bacterium]MCW5800865.1 tetratricopeptide repeat protein [Deltaproteobacteria bacterium]